eukprot:6172628-Pleurochrysis_carterae.AAC.2
MPVADPLWSFNNHPVTPISQLDLTFLLVIATHNVMGRIATFNFFDRFHYRYDKYHLDTLRKRAWPPSHASATTPRPRLLLHRDCLYRILEIAVSAQHRMFALADIFGYEFIVDVPGNKGVRGPKRAFLNTRADRTVASGGTALVFQPILTIHGKVRLGQPVSSVATGRFAARPLFGPVLFEPLPRTARSAKTPTTANAFYQVGISQP